MMETYEERLKTNYWQNRRKEREENTMSNYDMDEIERQRDREKRSRGIVLGEAEPEAAVTIELPDKDLLKLALAAHDRDITLNQLCVTVLKSSFKDLDYRFEHGSDLLHSQTKPQVLKEY